MKKIYFIVSLAVLALFTACQDYNETNFPDYDVAAIPTNVASYTYELTNTDYGTIANTIKQPIEDKITTQNNLVSSKQAELKAAKNLTDSTRIKAELVTIKAATTDSINKLKKESLYVIATSISTNKYFVDSLQFKNYIPIVLAKKYLFGDEKSSIMTTFNFVVPYDTTKIAITNKFTLDTIAYKSMGISAVSKSFYFPTSADADFKLPIWLKQNLPYSKNADVRLIRYKLSATVNAIAIYTFDGINWIKYNTTVPTKAKYTFKSGKWEYIDTDILIGLTTGIGDFKAINVVGDQLWTWNSYNYMLMTGYLSTTKEYIDNEDWLVSPPMNLTRRTSPWLTFSHVGRYFGDVFPDNTKMKKAITIWVSTTSDGKSINPSEWTQLSLPDAFYPSGADWKFISSTPISLAAYASKDNVRIAFKYLSSGADGAAGSWEIKNVYIYEK
ncbi:MAG: hypothetical protein GZ091_11580 [Paludibacter sp.]|nr:hypothetical protein [Paludibacter sp.]